MRSDILKFSVVIFSTLGSLSIQPAAAATYIGVVNQISSAGTSSTNANGPNPFYINDGSSGAYGIAQGSPANGGTAYSRAVSTNGGPYRAATWSEVIFDFQIVGPDLAPGTYIPVLVHAYGFARTSGDLAGNSQAGAQFQLSGENVYALAYANAFVADVQQFQVDNSYLFRPNVAYNVHLISFSLAGNAYDIGIGSAEALVDPTFTLDASYQSIYSFSGLLTPPTSAVPEPGSWVMMIAGFGLVGAVMRRRAARYSIET